MKCLTGRSPEPQAKEPGCSLTKRQWAEEDCKEHLVSPSLTQPRTQHSPRLRSDQLKRDFKVSAYVTFTKHTRTPLPHALLHVCVCARVCETVRTHYFRCVIN